MVNNRHPKQLDLPLDTNPDVAEFEFTIGEIVLAAQLCQTARDFLMGKLLTGNVPDEHMTRIKTVCAEADALIAKMSTVFEQKEQHDD